MPVCPVDCDCVAVEAMEAIEAPAIVVLGERHADRSDLKLARRAIDALAERAPVTVALEAVDGRKQEALDQLGNGGLRLGALDDATDWGATWGHAFGPYKTVFRAAVPFVAAGLPLGPAPEGREVPVPDGYRTKLGPMAEHHGMDPERFVSSMAWRDLGIAEQALQGWGGDGFLVVLAGRGHVSEGLGISWQIGQGLSEVPIHDFLLDAEGCATGDAVLQRR